MVLTKKLSDEIVRVSYTYLGKEFCWTTFNWVHFVREVYGQVGILVPLLNKQYPPPKYFHLTDSEFEKMPIGHSVFFRRRLSQVTNRTWTHVGIIIGRDEIIHCTRNLGNGVVITTRHDMLEVYTRALVEWVLFLIIYKCTTCLRVRHFFILWYI